MGLSGAPAAARLGADCAYRSLVVCGLVNAGTCFSSVAARLNADCAYLFIVSGFVSAGTCFSLTSVAHALALLL